MVRSVAPSELQAMFDGHNGAGLLDVREPFERAMAAIPAPFGVVDRFVPMRELPVRVDELQDLGTASNAPLIVYCHHGVRSRRVCEWLEANGRTNVWNLHGGIDAYSLDVDPSVPRY